MNKAVKLILVVVAMALSSSAYATDIAKWVVDAQKSTLTFSGREEGRPFSGSFADFTPEIVFAPEHLELSHIKVIIKTGSSKTDNPALDGDMLGRDWLASAQFPEATFETRSIRATGVSDKEGIINYEAAGNLTILGISKDIILPFALKDEGGTTHAFGEVTLKRLDFGVGVGADKNAQTVDNDIKVRFDIYAHP
ncbi:MAG: YceI family protein [Pseudobdellovibrionaceae bacterium]